MPWNTERGRKYWRAPQAPATRLLDLYLTDRANPMASPRAGEPGPGSFDLTDLDGRLSVAGGALKYDTLPSTGWDRTIAACSTSFTRAAGLCLGIQNVVSGYGYATFGWMTARAGTIANREAAISPDNDQTLHVTDGLTDLLTGFSQTAGLKYDYRIYCTRDGFLYYAKAATSSTWALLWYKTLAASRLSTLYAAANLHTQPGQITRFEVRARRLKPPQLSAARPGPGALFAGAANGVLDGTVLAVAGAQRGLLFRYQDASNYWKLVIDASANQLQLIKVQGGAASTIGATAFTPPVGDRVNLRVQLNGATIRTYSGTTAGPATTSTTFQLATLAGTDTGAADDYRELVMQTGGVLPD